MRATATQAGLRGACSQTRECDLSSLPCVCFCGVVQCDLLHQHLLLSFDVSGQHVAIYAQIRILDVPRPARVRDPATTAEIHATKGCNGVVPLGKRGGSCGVHTQSWDRLSHVPTATATQRQCLLQRSLHAQDVGQESNSKHQRGAVKAAFGSLWPLKSSVYPARKSTAPPSFSFSTPTSSASNRTLILA